VLEVGCGEGHSTNRLKKMFKHEIIFESSEYLNRQVIIAKKINPDIVLLDILLPGSNGLEFLRGTKDDKSLSTIPVLAFSNYTDPATEEEALKLGAKAYIIKADHDPEDTLEIIKKYIR